MKRNIVYCVRSGNTEKALIYVEKLLSFKVNDNRNSVEDWKKYANIFNINLRDAAINGGVYPIEALLIGEKFMNYIQISQDRELIKRKIYSLVEEYTSEVLKNETKGCIKSNKRNI